MNLTPEQADWVRARRAAGDAVIGLVVAGDWPKACPLADPTECNGEHCDCSLREPADWVALTGACETCDGDGRWNLGPDNPYWVTCDCIDGRKRATLTVACPACSHRSEWCGYEGNPSTWPVDLRCSNGIVPLVVATVEVVPVREDVGMDTPRPVAQPYRDGVLIYDGKLMYHVPLDRIPTPGVDFVVLLSDVVDA